MLAFCIPTVINSPTPIPTITISKARAVAMRISFSVKENNIKVSNQIIIVNNDRYKTFINWFIARYQNRVICKNLLELIQIFNANATSYKKLETPVMNFVVGSYNTEVDAPKVEATENKITPEPQKELQVSYGYASYWILAIVTLLVSAVIAVIAFTMK